MLDWREGRHGRARVAAAVLAGGQGRRLGGVVKPLLVVGGRRIIDRQLEILAPLFDRIAIVANDPAPFAGLEIPVIADRKGPGQGPLAGLDAALAWLPADLDAVVCVAADMPFLAPALLAGLRDAAPAAALVPRPSSGPEPLCARYHRSLAPVVAASLAAGTRAMHAFLDVLVSHSDLTWLDEPALRLLDPDLRTFTNINTPGDLSQP